MTTTPTHAAINAKNPVPDRVVVEAAPEAAPVAVALAALDVEPVVPDTELVVVAVAVLGYKRELVKVVQEDVAGMTGELPGGSWLSPKHARNTLGVYAAGMLKKQPCVSKMF
jgi:hypothetical protein